MIHPSYSELMKVVNSETEELDATPVVSSRYSIVLATSKRARQIIAGDEPLVHVKNQKPLSIAVEEVYKGKVKILSSELEEEDITLDKVGSYETMNITDDVLGTEEI